MAPEMEDQNGLPTRLRRGEMQAVQGCRRSVAPKRRSLHAQLNVMKEGLLGGTLCVSSISDHEEARFNVARWIGFEPQARGLLPARRGWRACRGCGGAAGWRWVGPLHARNRGASWQRAGARSDRVDERCAVRA